jgi:ketosteroid isomerase-like protein
MKLFLALCASALFLAPAISLPATPLPQTSASALERAVTDRSLAFAKAALDGDPDRFRAFMSDDYIMLWVEPAGKGKEAHWATMTKKEWVEQLRSGKHHYSSVELLNTKAYLHGDVANVTGDYTEAGTQDGVAYSEAGKFTETWVYRHGRWIIVNSVFP